MTCQDMADSTPLVASNTATIRATLVAYLGLRGALSLVASAQFAALLEREKGSRVKSNYEKMLDSELCEFALEAVSLATVIALILAFWCILS